MPNKTKHLYLTLVETSTPATASDELAGRIGVHIDTLHKLFQNLVKAGVAEKRKRITGGRRGCYAEYVLTGKPFEAPARKKSDMIHGENMGAPVIERFTFDWSWRSLNAWIQGDPPIGRSALDVGPPRPTHRVLA